MKTFNIIGLSVNIWWGHVNENEHGDKGVDDLLCGSLLGRESELMEDIERTMNSHDGRGTWLNIHKITEESDTKIRDFWSLNDIQAFYKIHKDRLTGIDTFKIGNIRYKAENGTLVPVSRYSSSSDIYSITQTSKGEDKVEFNDVEAFRFLAANGFHRLRNSEEAATGYDFIRIDDGIIDRVAPMRCATLSATTSMPTASPTSCCSSSRNACQLSWPTSSLKILQSSPTISTISHQAFSGLTTIMVRSRLQPMTSRQTSRLAKCGEAGLFLVVSVECLSL